MNYVGDKNIFTMLGYALLFKVSQARLDSSLIFIILIEINYKQTTYKVTNITTTKNTFSI